MSDKKQTLELKMHSDYKRANLLNETANAFEWVKWATQIPFVSFPKEWEVNLSPPIQTGVVGFIVRLKAKQDTAVFVNLHCYELDDHMEEPYWEIEHPNMETVYQCDMKDGEGLIKNIGQLFLDILQKEATDENTGLLLSQEQS